MNKHKPAAESPPEPISFSLGTLFLIVTTAGVASVAFRISVRGAERIVLAAIFASGFLGFWFLVTQQFARMRFAGTLFALGLVAGTLVSALDGGREPVSGHRNQCSNNLRQICLALHAYHQRYGSFPPAYVADASGKPLYSWRLLILPQLDNDNLFRQIRSDEAWDGPNNAKVTKTPMAVFACPSDIHSPKPSPAPTSYIAVVGPHTAWSDATPRKLSDFKNPSHTILVIEIANSRIQWTEPRDLYIGQMPMAVNPKIGQGISSDHPGGVNAVFADGSVHFIPDTIDPKKLAELLDLDGCNDESAY
jgi:prepilin-type processing-associated H-X9-DG protein